MSTIQFDTNIEELTRVGKTTASRLQKIGLEKVFDLLFYLPFRYDDFSKITSINELVPNENVSVLGTVELFETRRSPRKKTIITEAIISDETGSVKIIWFNQPFLKNMFSSGDTVYVSGKVNDDYHSLQFVSPVIEKTKQDTLHTARIVPIYSLTSNITQKQLRFLIKQSLPTLDHIEDWMPQEILSELNLVDLSWALRQIHFPDNYANLKKATERLKFNELFLLQLKIVFSKKEFHESSSQPLRFFEKETKAFVDTLPFTLTDDQKKVTWQCINDLSLANPANRLIEGEVGSGKTVVVAILFLNAFLNKTQTAFMAPTEILARQHFFSLQKFFTEFGISIGLLTGSESRFGEETISKKVMFEKVKNGEVDVVVGTHALIAKSKNNDGLRFKNLSLVVVDEQHRFGVDQRRFLKERSGSMMDAPHFISMTATPIPRTLSLIFYGDLKVSKLRQMPKNRKSIITDVVLFQRQGETYDFVRKQVREGRQIFVVCPLIDPSDKIETQSVTEEYENIQKIFHDLKVDFLHGKLKNDEKEEKMSRFSQGNTNILVTTSVIEVGVDIPNASVMIIQGAERFGLSQLHQFRGRVGRGEHQSYCFLFSKNSSGHTKKRLDAFMKAKDCFELSELDLEIRGPGEMFGSVQSGFSDLKVATLNDWQLAQKAQKKAQEVVGKKDFIKKYPLFLEKIKKEITLAHFE